MKTFRLIVPVIICVAFCIYVIGCGNPTGGGGTTIYTLTLVLTTEVVTTESMALVGTVETTPDGRQFPSGTLVTMEATSNRPAWPGYMFKRYTGDVTGENATKTFTMDSSKMVTAEFTCTPPYKYPLNITIDPASAGTVNESGTSPYDANTLVTMTAEAYPYYVFNSWSGVDAAIGNTATITMNGTKDVTASFKHLYDITVTATPAAYGTVWPTSEITVEGSSVTLIATAEPGYKFVSWEGDASGTQNPKTITVDGDKTIHARFRALYNYNLITTVTPDGSGTIEPWNGIFTEDTTAVITASANSWHTFDHWSGDLSGPVNPATISMDAMKDVTAHFSQTFLYVPNSNSNSISGYRINSVTGTLEQVPGSPFAAGMQPYGAAADPSGKYLYVPNIGTNEVSAYRINPDTGALEQISGSPFTAGASPAQAAVDPSGKYLYVSNYNSNNVSAYSINSGTGALTAIAGSPFAAGTTPFGVAADPSGKYLYVSNYASNNVFAYSINSGTGAITTIEGSPFTAGSKPMGAVVDPSGKYLYIANYISNNVSAYSINSGTGYLTTIEGSPFGAIANPTGLTADPSGKYLYVSSFGSSSVYCYSINSDTGALAVVSSIGAGYQPDGVAADPSGKYLYAANSGAASVNGYGINPSTGSLTDIAGSPYSVGAAPVFLTTVKISQ